MFINLFYIILNYSCYKLEIIDIIVIQNHDMSNMVFIFSLSSKISIEKYAVRFIHLLS